MHVHLPKPLHGWRAFAGEVGIIVVGVLIALTAEQLVETVHWRDRAGEARERLRYEVGHEFLLTEEREAVGNCIEAQLDLMEGAVLSSGATMTPLPLYRESAGSLLLTYTLRTPSRSWSDSAWQSVLSQGLAEHLTARERELLPIHYSQMARVSAASRDEDEAVGELVALARPLPLDPGVRTAFVRLIEGERQRNRLMTNLSAQMIETIERLGYVPDAQQRRQWLANSGTLKFCRAHHLPLTMAQAR